MNRSNNNEFLEACIEYFRHSEHSSNLSISILNKTQRHSNNENNSSRIQSYKGALKNKKNHAETLVKTLEGYMHIDIFNKKQKENIFRTAKSAWNANKKLITLLNTKINSLATSNSGMFSPRNLKPALQACTKASLPDLKKEWMLMTFDDKGQILCIEVENAEDATRLKSSFKIYEIDTEVIEKRNGFFLTIPNFESKAGAIINIPLTNHSSPPKERKPSATSNDDSSDSSSLSR